MSDRGGDGFNTGEYRELQLLFRDECQEALARASQLLLRCSSAIDPESLADLLRITHSLKGTAGTVGLHAFADLCHTLEDRFVQVRNGHIEWSPRTRDQLVDIVDGLAAMAGEPRAHHAESLARRLAAVAEPAQEKAAVGSNPDAARPPLAPPAQLKVDPSRIDRLMDSASELVFDRTRIERRVGELRTTLDDLSRLREQLLHAERGDTRRDTDGATSSAPLDAVTAPAAPAAPLSALIDELSDKIIQIDRLSHALIDDTAALRRTGNALQDGLTDIRMQSARALFQRLAPQVRALSRASGKPTRLVTTGSETEFDKSVADQILEPLIHLLRNAVAHGIEPPEVRRALGKPEEGVLTLACRHEGSSVVIELGDDGAGIDPNDVKRRLVERGRWTAARASVATTEEVFGALLAARISSRDTVDELAGRGIGLDAVRTTVVRLGGELQLTSNAGRGTTFSMRLPLTASITNALLFKLGNEVVAIASAHVAPPGDRPLVAPAEGALPATLSYQGEEIPLVDLHATLDMPRNLASAPPPVVVVDYASRRFAVTCDKLVGPREIVVKALGPLVSALPLYAGGTISGSGKVQLILDPAALLAIAYPDEQVAAPISPQAARQPGARRVLVADDSRVIRGALSRMLTHAGYKVDVADDGMVAWRLLGRARYDALITDLEMPALGGFELIERLRSDQVLAPLPVVIVSSNTGAATTNRAAKLAVRAVLSKPVDELALLAALTSDTE